MHKKNIVLETIFRRRSIRKYLDQPIKEDELTDILESGRYAPSGGNNQFCHFMVVQNEDILRSLTLLVEAEFAIMEPYEGMYGSLRHSILQSKKGGYDFIYHAKTFIIVANRKEYGNAMADSAVALENMMLAAYSLNIGTCWINQLHWLDENNQVRAFLYKLGLLENETICGALSLGYPESMEDMPLKRTGNVVTYIR